MPCFQLHLFIPINSNLRSNYYLSTSNCYLSELLVTQVKTGDLLSDSEWSLYESLEGPDCADQGDQGNDQDLDR